MYKLTVVAGPNRGTTFAVGPGETSVGRQSGNIIVLESARVSKQHCKIIVDQKSEQIILEDAGSANGTFVNGALARSRKVQPGDRISVGEFILELSRPRVGNFPAPLGDFAQVIPFPKAIERPPQAESEDQSGSEYGIDLNPTDLKGKVLAFFEVRVMPFFYNLLGQNEWSVVASGVTGVMLIATIFLVLQPAFDSSRISMVRELERRASLIARQIRDRNLEQLQSRNEAKTDIGSLANEPNVRVAVLTDLELRIIAPALRMNQYLLKGEEALRARDAANNFKRGLDYPAVATLANDVVVAVEPVRVYNPKTGQAQTIAMAVASIDGRASLMAEGDTGIIYSYAFLVTALVMAFGLIILYRLTIRPIEILVRDMDRALKGQSARVTRELRFSEMEALLDSVDVAIQRAATGDQGLSGALNKKSNSEMAMEAAGPLKNLTESANAGLAILDSERKIVELNSRFEEITGIRQEFSIGVEITGAARDQAFAALALELIDKAMTGVQGVSETFDFSGVPYRVLAMAFPGDQQTYRGFVLWVTLDG